MKKFVVTLFLLFLLYGEAVAQNLIKLIVTGDNVNLRDAPNSKGKVLSQAFRDNVFIVDATPVQAKDKSMWHKIIFSVDDYFDHLAQVHKLPIFNFSYPYISAKFVRQVPMTQYDRKELELLKQGRPPRSKIGDTFEIDGIIHISQAPIVLYKTPKNGAEKITIPPGTKFLLPQTEAYIHHDMEEIEWTILLGQNADLLGWITWEEFKSSLTNVLKSTEVTVDH
jgi:hypothetical protein